MDTTLVASGEFYITTRVFQERSCWERIRRLPRFHKPRNRGRSTRQEQKQKDLASCSCLLLLPFFLCLCNRCNLRMPFPTCKFVKLELLI